MEAFLLPILFFLFPEPKWRTLWEIAAFSDRKANFGELCERRCVLEVVAQQASAKLAFLVIDRAVSFRSTFDLPNT